MKQLLHFLIVDIYNIVPWSCGAISVGVWGGLTSLNLELYEGIRHIIMYVLIVALICRFTSMPRYIDADYFKGNQFIENFWKQGGGTPWRQSIVPTQFIVFPKIFNSLIKTCYSYILSSSLCLGADLIWVCYNIFSRLSSLITCSDSMQ